MAEKRRSRLMIGLGIAGLVVAVGVVVTGSAAVWLTTEAGSRWATRKIEDALSAGGARASVGSIHTDLWTGARIEDLSLETVDGTVVRVGRLDADIDRSALLRGELVFPRATADGVYVELRTLGPDDPPGEPFSGIGVDLVIDAVDLRGAQVSYRSYDGTEMVRVVGASGTARFVAKGAELRVEDLDVAALLGLTSGAVTADVTGGIRVDAAGTHLDALSVRLPRSTATADGSIEDELAIDLGLEHVAVGDLDLLLGHPGLAGELTGKAELRGPSDQLRWSADVDGVGDTIGGFAGSGTVDSTGDTLRWTVDGNLDGLDVSRVVTAVAEPVVLTGRAVVDGAGTSWPDELVATVDWTGSSHDAYGQHVDAATARLRLEDGAVVLEQTTLDGILGELRLTGRVETVDGPMNLRVTGSVRPHRLRELGVTGVDAPGWLDARIQGDLSDPDAPIRVTGTVRFAPFLSGDAIRFDEVVAGFTVRALGELAEGEATVDATGGLVGGVGIGAANVPGLTFNRGPGGLSVQGQLVADAVELPNTFSAATATGSWTFTDAGATADLTLGAVTLLGAEGTGGRVVVDQRGDDVAVEVRLEATDRDLLDTRGHYDLARGALALDALALSPSREVTWRAVRPLRLVSTETGLADADLALASELGELSLVGTIGTRGPVDARITTRALDLSALGALDPVAYAGYAGGLDLDLALTGHGGAAVMDGSFALRGLVVPETVTGLDAAGTLRSVDGGLRVDVDIGAAGTELATLGGRLPLRADLGAPGLDPDRALDLRLALLPGSFDRLKGLSEQAADLPAGDVSAALQLAGTPANPDVRLAGVVALDVRGWPDPQRTEFELTLRDGAMVAWADVRSGSHLLSQLSATASTDLESTLRTALRDGAMPADLDVYALVDDLFATGVLVEAPVALIARALGLEDLPLQGHFGGGFQVSGSADRPVLDGSFSWIGGQIGRQPVETMDLSLTPTGHGYAVDLDLVFPDGAGVEVIGEVPIVVDLKAETSTWATAPMNLAVTGPGIPMRALAALSPSVGKAEGVLSVVGEVGGTPFAPLPRLTLGSTGAAMTFNELGLRVEDLNLAVDVAPDRVTLHEVSGVTRPSRGRFDLQEAIGSVDRAVGDLDPDADTRDSSFTLSGDVGLFEGTPTDVGLRIRLDNGTWVVATSDLAMRLDGKLRVSGTWPELAVGGDLALRQGQVRVDAAAFVDRAPLEPDPRIAIVRPGAALRVVADTVPWYQDVTAAVNLDLRRALELEVSMPFVDDLGSIGAFVSRADLVARIGGETQLTMSDAVPSMVGELEVNDGRLKMLGRRFDVTSGRITFTGGDIAEPRLDILAETTVANIPIVANVGGTPSAPGIRPECDGYPDESDCLMILITGRTPDDEGSGSDSSLAAALAGMALGGVLGEQNVADISLEPDGSIQVGTAATNWLYITYRLDGTPAFGENQNTLEADVGLGRRLVLQAVAGDQSSSLDLFWEIRF